MFFDFLLAVRWNGAIQTSKYKLLFQIFFYIGSYNRYFITVQDLQSRLCFIKMLGSGSL